MQRHPEGISDADLVAETRLGPGQANLAVLRNDLEAQRWHEQFGQWGKTADHAAWWGPGFRASGPDRCAAGQAPDTARGRTPGINRSPHPRQSRPTARSAPSDTPPVYDSTPRQNGDMTPAPSLEHRNGSRRPSAARPGRPGVRLRWGVGDAVRVEYVSRVPRPPLDGLIDDLYYLEGAPPYALLTLPPMPSALLVVNLGAPFRIRAGTDIETAEYADGCVVTTPTRALEFGYPPRTRSVGVHFKPWGPAAFLPMPAAELRDRPVTVEQAWGRPAVAELRDRLATADSPDAMLTLLEEELMRRLRETTGLGLVRHTSSVIAAAGGAVSIGGLSAAAGVSSTHLAQRFKQLVGVTPKRLARTYRFAAAVFAIDPAEPVDWGDLAGRAGYFDQAHFGHEFREFTGPTPTRYLEVRRRFLREHPGHVFDGWPLPAD